MTTEELHNIYRAESRFWWYEGMRAVTAAMFPPLPPGPLRGLDAGCGSGFNALNFEHRFGIAMYGVDVAPLALRYCRERGFRRGVLSSVAALPFAEGGFDIVTSFDVLSHVAAGDDEKALREFQRVLRSGGWLLLRVPAFRALRSKHSEWIRETHRYQAPEMRAKLVAAGLRPVRWTYANFFLSPVALLHSRVWEPIRKAQPRSGVEEIPPVWLNRLLYGILKVEAACVGSGARLPFGQSLVVLARKD